MLDERMVYFLRADNGTIKIGSALNVKQRESAVNSLSPVLVSLVAVMPGGERKEAELHKMFSHVWLRGEWFNSCPEMEKLISAWAVPATRKKNTQFYSAGGRRKLHFITESVRNLQTGQSIFVSDAAPGSVKSIVSRLGVSYKGRRRFATRKEDNGVRVWRLP